MTRYRLTPFVREQDGEELWVASVPDGPILHVSGAGVLVLAVLDGEDPATAVPGEEPGDDERGSPVRIGAPNRDARLHPSLTGEQILERLAERIADLPEDAGASIEAFLAQLHTAGVVEALDSTQGGGA